FAPANIKYTALGIALPLISLAILKLVYAPPNDMMNGLQGSLISKAFMKERYALIYTYFTNNINDSFRYMNIVLPTALLCRIIQKKLPSLNIFMLLACLFCYMLFYVFTTQDLEWHLGTSQGRLMHQLMPATLYILM